MTTNSQFFTYLLRPLQRKEYPKAIYIGFTTDPWNRLRQHNGEIANGAKKTKSKRPWEMICFVSGFPTKVSALQFEWAWQHPKRSRFLKQVYSSKCSIPSGATGRIQVLAHMLNSLPWKKWPLHLNFTSEKSRKLMQSIQCVDLPEHMSLNVVDLEEFMKNTQEESTENNVSAIDLLGSSCNLCLDDIWNLKIAQCYHCKMNYHLTCLAQHMIEHGDKEYALIPDSGTCPSCLKTLQWPRIVQAVLQKESNQIPEEDVADEEMSMLSLKELEVLE